MSEFKVHDKSSAPSESADFLGNVEKQLGFIPNLAGVMAESPALLKGYFTLSQLFDQTSLSPSERQTVLLSVSYRNACDYCMAAHSAIAGMQDVPEEVVQALREGREIPDPKLEALSRFTRAVVDKRGWPDETDLSEFHAAGYTQTNVLEVILGVGMKTLSNYTNHVAGTPLDEAFEARRWSKAG